MGEKWGKIKQLSTTKPCIILVLSQRNPERITSQDTCSESIISSERSLEDEIICKIPTDDNVADPLTKPLARVKHVAHACSIGMQYLDTNS
ncbi:LOW QUALITY PROTEIN: hypothetical protein OSB04_019941 [Centaurea solstitialis]|uniref:Uncharacterized protein n=1 Tax=Centaurea solstitialis TaxID=347529 RepID=A0AA38SYW6_9ASTR|nr:LOW QUALITY PROTEIN: hypothetical protein OSB04_019941 [Centaurea solstitialis]